MHVVLTLFDSRSQIALVNLLDPIRRLLSAVDLINQLLSTAALINQLLSTADIISQLFSIADLISQLLSIADSRGADVPRRWAARWLRGPQAGLLCYSRA